MKLILLCITALFCKTVIAQPANYWQQHLSYNMKAELNDETNTIKGIETIVYRNNSPATLNFIWFHIWANCI